MKTVLHVMFACAVLLLAVQSVPAMAQTAPQPPYANQQTPPPNPVDGNALSKGKVHFESVSKSFHSAAKHWQQTLGNFAQRLFWLLAFIELVWLAARMVLRGADFQEWVTELVKYILFVGFFAALLIEGPHWAQLIIKSFARAAASAGQAAGDTVNTSPSDIFATGINIAYNIQQHAHAWNIGKQFGAIIIALLFAAIAAMLVLAWIETYFVVYASILFLGFGGSRFTSEYAKKVLMLAVSAGAKLFILLLIASLINSMASQWAHAAADASDPSVLSLLGLCALGAYLCVRGPSLLSAVTSGSVGSGSGLMAASAAVATAAAGTAAVATGGASLAVGAAQAAHGAGAATSAASGLAGAAGKTGMGRVASTVGNLGKAGMREAGRSLGGPLSGRSANGGRGNFGTRMADSMTAKAQQAGKPSAPGGGSPPPGGPQGSGNISGGSKFKSNLRNFANHVKQHDTEGEA